MPQRQPPAPIPLTPQRAARRAAMIAPAQVERNIFEWHQPAYRRVMEALLKNGVSMHVAFSTNQWHSLCKSSLNQWARGIVFAVLYKEFGASHLLISQLTGASIGAIRTSLLKQGVPASPRLPAAIL